MNDRHTTTFALIDVTLRDETSHAVANGPGSMGGPFVLAIGTERSDGVLDGFPDAPILNAPFSDRSLLDAVAKALDRSSGAV